MRCSLFARPSKLRCFFIAGLLLMLGACSKDTLRFPLVNGGEIDFNVHQGKYIFLNYWSPTCLPCLHEIPVLNRFHEKHHLTHAIVVGVDYDHPPVATLKALIKQYHIHYPMLIKDPGDALHIKRVNYLPTTFVLNAQGDMVASLIGPQTEASLEKMLHSLQKSSA